MCDWYLALYGMSLTSKLLSCIKKILRNSQNAFKNRLEFFLKKVVPVTKFPVKKYTGL